MNSIPAFLESLNEWGISFYTGVPDSLLSGVSAYLSKKVDDSRHVIAANEGGAVGLAIGYHLATGQIPLVYLQNSGLGNTINPLLSLADSEVYSIPMVLLIGWRGQPGHKDEPQHKKQGRVQNQILAAMEIPYLVLEKGKTNCLEDVKNLVQLAREKKIPVALVCEKDFFQSEAEEAVAKKPAFELTREEAIGIVAESISDAVFVSTTGKASRELVEMRARNNQGSQRDFLTVGGMGHCSQIALGVSLFSDKTVVCLDGDGAILMHLGSLPIIGSRAPKKFIHVMLNNGCHESVGGQETVALKYDFSAIAKAFSYGQTFQVQTKQALQEALSAAKKSCADQKGPIFIEILVLPGSRSELGRPKQTPQENKNGFMEFLKGN